ncbi:hypothetical protein M0R45_000636 [Rubus argutus]|uniref:Cyclic nucleotide-binding domain-containing protein n=1 Tax=Rubus argutus TaxID=59490 RepID=A0AAW1VPI4_RUBAR
MASDILDDEWPQSSLRSYILSQEITCLGDDECELLEIDRVTMLRKVPKLEHTDDIMLNKFCNKLIIMRYGDESPYIIEEELDKMFLIVSGLVSITSIKGGQKVYRYSGNYWGDELFEWALQPSRATIIVCRHRTFVLRQWGMLKCSYSRLMT